MKYIKIRKPPEVRPEGDCLKLTTVVSITSDLGDSYRQSPVELKIGISGRNSNKQCDTHTWTWNYKGTHESERIELDISRKICKKVKDSVETDHAGSTVVCLCISTGTHRSPGGFGDQLGIDRNMLVAAQTVSAWTDPFVLDFKHAASKAPPTLQRQFCGLEGPELSIWESTNQSIAGHIWDAGAALTAYLDNLMLNGNTDPATDHIEGTQRLKVIELGCGCGIVGRHFAQIVPKCDVLLTDASPIDVRNSLPSEAMENKASQLRFAKLDWDAAAEEQATETANDLDQPELREPWDMVLISDCTYNWDAVPALVRTINWLKDRRNKHIVVVVASKKRHDDESVFFDTMKSESWKITSALRIRMAHLEEEEVDENTDIFVFRPKMEIARYPPPVAQMTALQALWRDDWDPEFSQIHAEIKEDRGIPDDA